MAEPNSSLRPDSDHREVDNLRLIEAIPNLEHEVVDIKDAENCSCTSVEVGIHVCSKS